jgi:hypothetical protein
MSDLLVCPLMALSGRSQVSRQCLLSGVKRAWACALQMSAYDPKRTDVAALMPAFRGKADMAYCTVNVSL